MTRTRLLHQAKGRWAWLIAAAAAAAAAGLLAVRRGTHRRAQADSTAENGSSTPGAPETAETAPTAGTLSAAAPDQDEVPPGTGNGSAAQTPAADGLLPRDR